MPYKKRVFIFISVMSVIFIGLSIFYVAQVKSSVENLNAQDLKPTELDNVKQVLKGSSLKNIFEFEE